MGTEDSFNSIVEYFKNLANSHPSLECEEFDDEDTENFLPLVGPEYVYNQLKLIEAKSSCGPENIPSFIYKEFGEFLYEPITSLINLSLIKGKCPKVWKESYMITIPKCNNPNDPSQLRPISITSHIVKICEKHILSNLLPSISDKLDEMQFGGLPGRSTTQYIVFYLDKILGELEKKGDQLLLVWLLTLPRHMIT